MPGSRTTRAAPLAPSAARHLDIVDYYRETDRSFAHWGGAGAYPMHYGYHDRGALDHDRALVRMNEVIAEAAKLERGSRILDAGCGVGATSLWLAHEYRARVCGVTLSPMQVDKAIVEARRRGLADRARFVVADYGATGLEDASFDAVWAIESLCHSDEKRSFLAEARRLLRTGGRIAVADYFLTEDAHDAVTHFALERWFEGWCIAPPPTGAAFAEALSRAGFTGIEARDFTDAIRPSSDEMYRRGKEGFPDEMLTAGKNVVQIRHVEACLFQKIALDLGAWRYRLYTAER